MPRPTARVLALLELLQSRGGTRTVGELADRLGVDERTVRRYVAHLADLDVPVESVRGRYGGVRLAPGYRLPPLMFTDDEALAVLLGLVAGGRAGLGGAPALATESATAKLRRVLPRALAARLDALLDTVEFTAAPRSAAPPESGTLLLLAEAARDRRPVEIEHTTAEGRTSRRVVQPYGVVAHAGRWYLTGADDASGEIRTFRVDRVTAARTAVGTFDVPVGFDAAATVLAAVATAPHRYRVSLRVQGGEEQVRVQLPDIAVVTPVAGAPGHVRVILHVERLEWVPGALARLDRPWVLEGPDELRPLVRALADRLAVATR